MCELHREIHRSRVIRTISSVSLLTVRTKIGLIFSFLVPNFIEKVVFYRRISDNFYKRSLSRIKFKTKYVLSEWTSSRESLAGGISIEYMSVMQCSKPIYFNFIMSWLIHSRAQKLLVRKKHLHSLLVLYHPMAHPYIFHGTSTNAFC